MSQRGQSNSPGISYAIKKAAYDEKCEDEENGEADQNHDRQFSLLVRKKTNKAISHTARTLGMGVREGAYGAYEYTPGFGLRIASD